MIRHRFGKSPSSFGHPLARAVVSGTAPEELYAPLKLDDVPSVGARRADVVAILREKNLVLGNPHVGAMIAKLEHASCRVVITGQQPGLFGGPLFTFEKLAGAIALAADIERKTDAPCVAVFWNQSEDHDLVEINRIEIPKKDGVHRDTAPLGEPGRCLDHIVVDDTLVAWADEALRAHWPGVVFPVWLHPVRGERLPDWTSRILIHAMADSAFLVAEPGWFRVPAAPLYANAIRSVERFHAAFAADTERVRAAGFEPQIDASEPSGLFLVEEDGTRVRLHWDGSWKDARGNPWTESRLVSLAESNPRALSTSVQIRPLVQSWLLPVVAQIGGPAEVAYFAQFGALYRAAALRCPMIVQRPTSVFLGPKEAAMAEGLGVPLVDVLDDPTGWPKIDRPSAIPVLAGEHLKAAVAELRAMKLSEPLTRAVDGFAKTLEHAAEKLDGTLRREAERAEGVEGDRRTRLAEWVRPKGRPQDRMTTLPDVLARMSIEDFRSWMRALHPAESRTMIVTTETST